MTHWDGCTGERIRSWAGRAYCAGCGVWLSPPWTSRTGVRTTLTGDKRTEPASARTLNRPLDGAAKEPHP